MSMNKENQGFENNEGSLGFDIILDPAIAGLTMEQVNKIVRLFSSRTIPDLSPAKYAGRYIVVRSSDSGVHVGTMGEVNETAVEMLNTRRIWSWSGSFTLSEVSRGVWSDETRMSAPVESLIVNGWCELLPMTEDGRDKAKAHPVYTPTP